MAAKDLVITLVRHAEAVERVPGLLEENRWLTPRGRVSFAKTARRLARKGLKADLIVTSPLVRAVQTAEILAAALDWDGEIVATGLLASGFDRSKLQRLLKAHPEARRVVLVGHEPDLGTLVAELAGLEDPIELRKGGIVSLRVPAKLEAGTAAMRWAAVKGKVCKSR